MFFVFKWLSGPIKDKLATRGEATNYAEFISLDFKPGNRLRESRRGRASHPPPFSPVVSTSSGRWPVSGVAPLLLASDSPGEESMQQGRARLSPAERLGRINASICI